MLSSNLAHKRAFIYTGGRLGRWALTQLPADDVYLIGADRGAEFLIRHGYSPDLAIGDFDSVTSEQLKLIQDSSSEFISCDAVDKDWSDTELALREAISRGCQEIRLFGALGTRFDHSLSNVHLLLVAHEQGCALSLHDEHNEIRLCVDHITIPRDDAFPYTSLLPLTPQVKGITLDGFRYPLHDATISLGSSLGISNVLICPVGTITIADGLILVIRSRD